jgi:hypothetical protein
MSPCRNISSVALTRRTGHSKYERVGNPGWQMDPTECHVIASVGQNMIKGTLIELLMPYDECDVHYNEVSYVVSANRAAVPGGGTDDPR